MSLFPKSFITNDQTPFSSLSYLFDGIDEYSRGQSFFRESDIETFTPNFDVKELGDAYELHGELPGIEQKDVEIEFTDSSTITIKGSVERSYTKSEPSSDKSDSGSQNQMKNTQSKNSGKFWVMERNVGEFSRTFSFPARVEQDGVKAFMKNGVLSVRIPKSKQHESRKIRIS
ncbi:Bgt-4352 [Blumeria graminis f. sp. tritici]|uniref:Bgt-4352 n=2 Tax=Blumeria graminis f. sp. tritici TaxID=62690 RepID=A0A9X9QGK1_BLUGR|nr:hypothetical protein BGT96224_4352 [Blumeria graminis f. sp. tritici 96224]VDB95021.1 Bgt-4352 [Blumeria graminis f. sp. tritici]